MKHFLLMGFFLMLSTFSQAQDMDIYKRYVGDKEKMPDLYENMTFDDYQMLTRDIRMMDMMYSTIVPGYIHYKAGDKKTGNRLLIARSAAYSGLLFNYIRLNSYDKSYQDMLTDPSLKGDRVLFYTSISVVAITYMYDWIHGKRVLENKQEQIRYKYGIKLKMEKKLSFQPKAVPALSLTLNF